MSKVIFARQKKACDYRRCVQASREPDVERLVKGKRAMAEFKAKKLASRGKEKTTRSKTEVGRPVVGKGKGGKKVRIEKGQNSLARETCGGPTTHARVLARRSTSEWGVGGKKKCSVVKEDVVKKEPMIFVEVVKDEAEKEEDEEEVAMSGAGEEVQFGEVAPVIRDIMPAEAVAQASVALLNDAEEMVVVEPVEEVAVIQMEIPNFQIDQATSLQEEGDSHQTRRKGEVREREDRASFPVSTPSAEDEVMEEEDTVDFLGSAKLAKRKIDQKKASLERTKQKVEFKRTLLQDLESEEVEDEKRKTELQLIFKAVEKEKSEIVQRQQERSAKAADLQVEIEASEKVKVDKEEDLEREEAKVQDAFLLFKAAAPK